MKYALIGAIWLALAINFAPRGEAQQKTNDTQQKTTNQGQSSLTPTSETRRTDKADPAQDNSPYWDKAPQWILVIIGGITFFAIWYQACKTKDAAEATQNSVGMMADQAAILKESVAVARTSAEGLINSERAWVMVEVQWDGQRSKREVNSADGVTRTSVGVRIICRNEGRSPAWIKQISITLKIHNYISADPTLPTNPSDNFVTFYPLPVGQGYTKTRIVIGEGWSNTETNLLYGAVMYQDFSGKMRETWFAYVVSDAILERFPEPAYNKNT